MGLLWGEAQEPVRGLKAEQGRSPSISQDWNYKRDRRQSLEEILHYALEAWEWWIKEKWMKKGQATGKKDRENVDRWTKEIQGLRLRILEMTLGGRLDSWQEIRHKKANKWMDDWEESMRKYTGRKEWLEKRQKWETTQKGRKWGKKKGTGQREWEEELKSILLEEEERIERNRLLKWKTWDKHQKRRRRVMWDAWQERDGFENVLWGSMKALLEDEWDLWVAERVRAWVAEGRATGILLRLQEVKETLREAEGESIKQLWDVIHIREQAAQERRVRGQGREGWGKQQGDREIREKVEAVERIQLDQAQWSISTKQRNTLEERARAAMQGTVQAMAGAKQHSSQDWRGHGEARGTARDRLGRMYWRQQTNYWLSPWENQD